MLLLTQNDVKNIVTMKESIDIVEKAFISYSRGKAEVPHRTQISIPDEKAVALYMPGYVERLNALGLKIVSVFPNNKDINLPTINSIVVMNDTKTGEPIAAMEGSYLTALRTGAASGVATKYFARDDASVVAIIGAGIQARTQLEAVCNVRDIKAVKVFDLSKEQCQTYIASMKKQLQGFDLDYQIADSPEEAIEGADIICTSTTSKKPVFSASVLKKGAHINAVGAFTPEMQEIGVDVLEKVSKICVDSQAAVLEEAGDLIIPIKNGDLKEENIYGEIGEVAEGKKAGREGNNEITLFKTVGISAQDMAIGSYILSKALDLGIGKEFDFMGE